MTSVPTWVGLDDYFALTVGSLDITWDFYSRLLEPEPV